MTVVLVATNGGHLAQLVDLAPRLGVGEDRLWVTQPGPQADSLLAGERRFDAPVVNERDVRGVARAAVVAAGLYRRHEVEAVISTGSGIALGFLPTATLFRIPAHYIESSTFVSGPSVTGRVLQRLPKVHLYTQHPGWAGGRWSYRGSVFDGFERLDGPGQPPRRVVVTVGSDRWPFRPLIERLAGLLPAGADVTWQTGPTPLDGLDIPARPFLPAAELEQAISTADVVVAHAGCGSAMTALRLGKLPVLVPRDPARGEVIDGHQQVFADALERRGLAVVRAVEDLTYEDLCLASGLSAQRTGTPPAMELVR